MTEIKPKERLTQSELKAVLSYDPQTGAFASKRGPVGYVGSRGYVLIRVGRFVSAAHRLAWLYMTGSWPRHTIDHINRNRSDNRLINLRDVTFSENLKNIYRGPLAYVHTVRDRYGRAHHYYRRPGFRDKLAGELGTPEFMLSYSSAATKYERGL